MKKFIITSLCLIYTSQVFGQFDENKEKFTLLAGITSTGSEFVIWSDNVYGGNVQFVYDFIKIEEGAIAFKGSFAWSDGFSGYYGGANLRIGTHLFGDIDLLLGYSSISNEKLLSGYKGVSEYNGGAFVGNIGFGYRFITNPLLIRFAINSHFPFNGSGFNYGYNLQIGYRF